MNAFGLLGIVYSGLVIGIALPGPVSAGDIPGYPDQIQAYDAREVAMLPRYCKYTQDFRDKLPGGRDQAELDRWYQTMGPGFHAMHHYCWGLMKTNRAVLLAKSQQIKVFYLGSSIDEFNFVLGNTPPDFVLLPEILTKKGQNLILLGRGALGALELEHAIDAKPDYWPPYAALSDYYKNIGDLGQAREYLQKGLALVPDAKALTDRLAELDSAKVKTKRSQRVSPGDK